MDLVKIYDVAIPTVWEEIEYSNFWLYFGIILGCVFVLILIAMIIVYIKREKR